MKIHQVQNRSVYTGCSFKEISKVKFWFNVSSSLCTGHMGWGLGRGQERGGDRVHLPDSLPMRLFFSVLGSETSHTIKKAFLFFVIKLSISNQVKIGPLDGIMIITYFVVTKLHSYKIIPIFFYYCNNHCHCND